MSDRSLIADCVGKRYGERRILQSATLEIRPGTLTYLAGRNGVGKSTLMKIACGWLSPDHGTVRVDRKVYARARLSHLARSHGVYYLADRRTLLPHARVGDQLQAVAARFNFPSRDQLVHDLRLEELLHAFPDSISSGEGRRAELSLAAARQPRFLLADEPTRGASPLDTALILMALRRCAQQGCGVVVTGHDPHSMLDAADVVCWCTSGTTYQLGSPAVARAHSKFRLEYLGTLSDSSRTC
jgi:lipopolysaccharide export system ATP-binding protein